MSIFSCTNCISCCHRKQSTTQVDAVLRIGTCGFCRFYEYTPFMLHSETHGGMNRLPCCWAGLARRNHFYYLALGSRPFEHWTLELVHGTVTTCCLRRKPENTYPRKNCSGTGTARVIFEGWNFSRPVSQLLECHRCTSACKCLDTFPYPMKWPQFKGVERNRQAWQELRSRILTGTYE